MSCKKFTVAVCGGGIGGLTCALALSKYPDIDVTVYEATAKLGEVGAGIGLLQRPWQVLKALGLEDDLVHITEFPQCEGPVATFHLRKSDQPDGFVFYTVVTNGGTSTFHRADFQQVLLKHLPRSCKIIFSKRMSSYHQSQHGPITLRFEDGSTETCDILVGADGIKSPTRRSLLLEWAQLGAGEQYVSDLVSSINPTWSGTIVYRALIPADSLRSQAPDHNALKGSIIYMGKGGQCVAYPISQGRTVNFAAFRTRDELENTLYDGPWTCTAKKEEFINSFSNWEPEVQALLNCVENTSKWTLHTVKPLHSYVQGRVALLGDAAHAMTPHQGSGAGQAIEDAYLLATLLGHPHTSLQSASFALQVYDIIRRPFTSKIVELSRLNGRYYAFNFDEIDFDNIAGQELRERLQELGEAIREGWKWSWTTTLDEAVQEAIQMLTDRTRVSSV